MENTIINEQDLYNDAENIKIDITDHCLNRYSERVMGRPIIGNDAAEKATNEIKKLFISSTLYYTGVIGNSKNPVRVYCNRNGWTLIVSVDGKKIITLYKVDLMVDSDEVNQLYVDKALEKISKLKEEYDATIDEALHEDEKCDAEITNINKKINEYEQLIKELKERKNAVSLIKSTNTTKNKAINNELRDALQDFIIKDKLKIEDSSIK